MRDKGTVLQSGRNTELIPEIPVLTVFTFTNRLTKNICKCKQ